MAEIAALQNAASATAGVSALSCRSCGGGDLRLVIDLGVQPLANSYIPPGAAMRMEPHYPLVVFRCPACHLVQVPQVASASELFSDYRYLSSYSTSWLDHAQHYVELMVQRFGLDSGSRIVEIASNDGYLLQYAIAKGISALGVEPAANIARIAEERGVRTHVAFFGTGTARQLRAQGWLADLMVANNVLAHVPDINDFAAGFSLLLKPEGVATFEFPHLLNLLRFHQFDTIYHEHLSYISLLAASFIFARHDLQIFDVEQLPTHGGSLRLYVSHAPSSHPTSPSVRELLAEEKKFGFEGETCYRNFSISCRKVRNDLLSFLIACAERDETVCAYGAAAKGNTLLNFCGVRPDLIAFVADRNPYKQGCLLPGTRIPVHEPEELARAKPNYILILPWNLKDEITESLAHLHEDGCRFVTAIPKLHVF